MRLKFGLKMGLAICLLAVGTTSAGLIYFYSLVYRNVWNELAARLADIGRAGQFLLTEEHRAAIERLNEKTEKLTLPRDEKLLGISAGQTAMSLTEDQVKELEATSDFQLIVNVMRQIKNASRSDVTALGPLEQVPSWYKTDPPLIRFVYILVTIPQSKDRSILKFIVDGDNDGVDMDGDGKISDDEQPTEIGQLYNVSEQPGLRAAFDGKVHTSEEYYQDKWGTWMSAYIPIKSKDGRTIAVMGIDMSALSQVNLVQRLKYLCIAVILASLLLSIVISYLISRWLAHPIVLLREGAERVKNRDYNTKIEIHTGDELGVLASTFNAMVEEVREHARTLEDKVAARTNELQNTLQTVQALKAQQDADYYLTNLLANPLFKNYNRSKDVKTEFFVKQKKEFTFRNKAGELGGDMCVTGNLKIRGKRYTLFVSNIRNLPDSTTTEVRPGDAVKGLGETKWSATTELLPELFPPANVSYPKTPTSTIIRFRQAGGNLVGFSLDRQYLVRKEGAYPRMIEMHEGFGVTNSKGADSVGSMVYVVTHKGLKAVDVDGNLDDVRSVNYLLMQEWEGQLGLW
jgi:HAMP domain-containing protein